MIGVDHCAGSGHGGDNGNPNVTSTSRGIDILRWVRQHPFLLFLLRRSEVQPVEDTVEGAPYLVNAAYSLFLRRASLRDVLKS